MVGAPPAVSGTMRAVWRALANLPTPSDSRAVARVAKLPKPSVRRALIALELGGFVKCYDKPKQCDGRGRVLRQRYIAYLQP